MSAHWSYLYRYIGPDGQARALGDSREEVLQLLAQIVSPDAVLTPAALDSLAAECLAAPDAWSDVEHAGHRIEAVPELYGGAG
jgi:hypothetical protein